MFRDEMLRPWRLAGLSLRMAYEPKESWLGCLGNPGPDFVFRFYRGLKSAGKENGLYPWSDKTGHAEVGGACREEPEDIA